jgi:hypothetical protein
MTLYISGLTREDAVRQIREAAAQGFTVVRFWYQGGWFCNMTDGKPEAPYVPPIRRRRSRRPYGYSGGELSAGQELIDLGIEMRHEEMNEPEW